MLPVFFLSDYGRTDEFVGVVHAVLERHAPGIRVVDLLHDVRPFDVRGGAFALQRTVGYLGPGVVLAVVDPGVGGGRAGLLLETAGGQLLIGPDNGLLLPAAGSLDGVIRAIALDPIGPGTFDGRDLFAPAAAACATGTDPLELGEEVALEGLVRLAAPVLERHTTADAGRTALRAEVTWVDRFGNIQLAATDIDLPAACGLVAFGTAGQLLRRVVAFADLESGEAGILLDAAGHLAVVLREASAARRFDVGVGDLVELSW